MIIALYPPILKADIVEGSAYDLLLKRHPHPAQHDPSLNTLFCETVENLTEGATEEPNKVYLSDVALDESGEPLEGDNLLWWVAVFMVQPNRPALYADKSTFSWLYGQAPYQLYCAKYEDQLTFQTDIAYVTNMIIDGGDKFAAALPLWESKTKDINYADATGVMHELINAFSA